MQNFTFLSPFSNSMPFPTVCFNFSFHSIQHFVLIFHTWTHTCRNLNSLSLTRFPFLLRYVVVARRVSTLFFLRYFCYSPIEFAVFLLDFYSMRSAHMFSKHFDVWNSKITAMVLNTATIATINTRWEKRNRWENKRREDSNFHHKENAPSAVSIFSRFRCVFRLTIGNSKKCEPKTLCLSISPYLTLWLQVCW